MSSGETYTIHDQRHYLLYLGTGKWSSARASRRQLLQSFLDNAHLRHPPWPKSITDYAEKLLALESGGF